MWNRFDILRKLPDGGIVWIEAVQDLEAARARIQTFATHKPGDYVIFSQETQSVMESPWVPYQRQELEVVNPRAPAKSKSKKKVTPDSPSKPSTKQIIRQIVADIARTAGGKNKNKSDRPPDSRGTRH